MPKRWRFWRQRWFWQWAGQGAVVVAIALLGLMLWTNLTQNLQQLGLNFGFGFLASPASFDIGETPIPYTTTDSYSRALLVGLVNSLRVIVFGIALTTVVGVTVGLARLTDNWLVRQISRIYVETLRNTPLLLQLFFWYFAVFLNLPSVAQPLVLFNAVSLSKQGIAVSSGPGEWYFSSEFSVVLLGLTLYTGAFIAEIVRGGIRAVPQGQWEAARALGLKPGLVLRLVVFPQALRVIVPPLISQYLNLAKNSSLAIAVGYSDLYVVANTTANQTGRAVEIVLLLMGAYLSMSLLISLLLNLYNRTVQLKER